MPFSGKIVRKNFLFFISMLSTGFLVSNGSNIEARSLISFKQSSVSADPNGVLRHWILSSPTPCSWKGVSCSAHGQVIKLNLTNGGLVGQLHISHLMNMPNLAYVYLTGNYFTGNLSSTAQTCSFVNLDLSANNFSEPLDAESILSCKSLVSLNISFNSIPGGHLNFGPSLQSLDLSRNKISEFGLLNDSLNHCQNLNLLNFSDNKLHTTALNISLSHCTSLSILDLSYNIFNGAVADTFLAEAPQSLRFLDLSHNNLSDNLVSIEFGACQNLTMLDLSYNVFSAPGFSRSLSNCQSLEKLDISHNQLHQIPGQSLGELKKLRKLYLSNNNIYGEIPSELALLCGSLEELDLSANQFTGQLPSAFVSCSSLFNLNLGENKLSGDFLTSVVSHLPSMRYLYIPFNNVTGPVPRSLTNCSQLRVLDLSSNSFIGDVPFEFCTTKSVSALEKLLLPNNHLTGIIPSQLGLCRNLKVINLSFNNLSGSIPSEIWNLPTLSNLVMWANSITGDIPEGLCNNGKSLERIILNNNLITGALPKSIANCTNLVWLSLSNNRLTGEIPLEIGNLVNLAILQLANNLLTGLLPPGLGNCSSLVWLDLNTNRLTGPIPATLADQSGLVIPRNVSGNPFAFVRNENRNCRNVVGLLEFEGIREDDLVNSFGIIACLFSRIYTGFTIYTFKGSGSMVFLDLSYNSLSGSIPEGIGSMTYLQVLNFGHNKLTGNIPSNFGSLKIIGVIDLSYNSLQGFIPGSLGSLSFLSNLDVSNNNLTGNIPSAGQLTTFPTSSYENNSCLCGIPMPPCGTFCGQHDISSSDDGEEEESWLISHDSFAHGFLTSFFPSFLLVFALYMWAFKKKTRRR